jgi:hypothetical protein
MREHERAGLGTMPGHPVCDTGVDMSQLGSVQAYGVKPVEVIAITLANMHMPGMLGEEQQETIIPQQGSICIIEQAHCDANAIQ